MHITPKTSKDDIRSNWGASIDREAIRTGSSRRGRLQRLARLRSRDYDTVLSVDPEHPTAHVDMEPDSAPEIVVTGREVDQPITTYSPEAWDWLVHKAMTIHEVGHVKYTDHTDFMARLDDVDSAIKGTVKQIWNALEDGAIEMQIRRRWPNYSVPLLHMRANLFADNTPGIPDPEKGGYVVPVAHATFTGALDLATYNSGVYARLLDDSDPEYHFASERDRELYKRNIAPLLAALVPKVLSEPVGARRNKLIFEFIEDIAEYIDRADADGQAQMNRDEQNSAGMPDDASEGTTGGAESDADALDSEAGDQTAQRISDIVGPDGAGDETAEDAPVAPVDPDGTLAPEDEMDAANDATDGSEGDEATDPVQTDETIEQEYSDDVADQRMEQSGATGSMLEELDRLSGMLAGGDQLEEDRLVVPEDRGDGDRDRYNRYKTNSARFETHLRNRLQKERKSKTRRGTRRGRFTGQGDAMMRVKTGQKGVKQRTEKPDEKDYAFLIITDRSGSMRGDKIIEAEETTNTVGNALEAVGADVMTMDLLSSKATVTKPFGVEFDQRVDHTCNATTGGGTPLAQCIRLGRERLNQYPTSAQKAMLVVTDGQPAKAAEYGQELDACTMPVIGVQLTDGSGAGEEFYHRYVTAQPGSGELQSKIQELVQEAMDI